MGLVKFDIFLHKATKLFSFSGGTATFHYPKQRLLSFMLTDIKLLRCKEKYVLLNNHIDELASRKEWDNEIWNFDIFLLGPNRTKGTHHQLGV